MPLAAIACALIGLWITWDHPHLIDHVIGFAVLAAGVGGTIWGLWEQLGAGLSRNPPRPMPGSGPRRCGSLCWVS